MPKVELSDEELKFIKKLRSKKEDSDKLEQQFIAYINEFKKDMDPDLFEQYDLRELYNDFLNKRKLEQLSKFEEEAWNQYGEEESLDKDENGW